MTVKRELEIPRAIFFLLAVHLLLFIFIAIARPMAFLRDDAFYSLTIAANIAGGHGITYGGFPTNGFQPLYSLIMAPLFFLLGQNRMLCLKIALLICGIFSTGSLFVLYRIGKKWAGSAAAIFGVLLGALSVNLLAHSASGLETSLYGFLFLLLVYLYTRDRENLTASKSLKFGLFLGILALARFDSCFLFMAIAIDRFWINKNNLILAVKENLVIFVPACLVIAPWFIWSFNTLGTFFQSSGAFHHWRGLETQGIEYFTPGFFIVAFVKIISLAVKLPLEPLTGYNVLLLSPVKFLLDAEKLHGNPIIHIWQKNPLLVIFLVAIAGILLFGLIRYGKRGLRPLARLRPLAWILPAPACAALFYALYHINYSMRHFYHYSLLLSIPVAIFFLGFFNIGKTGKFVATKRRALLIAILIITIFRWGPFDPKLKSGNEYGFETISHIRATIPKGESVGYTDCGFYGYFLPDYNVVNLDGILNFEALDAIKNNRLSKYIIKNDIRYILRLDNFTNEYQVQFETDILPVLEPVGDKGIIYKLR